MAEIIPFLPFPEESDEVAEDDLAPGSAGPAQPPDAAARTIALNIRRSFIVEAPAGSGKTGLLIQRFLKLLADESVTAPEQVLAITFTNKATAEMRDRVLGHLEAARLEAAELAAGEFESIAFDLAAQAHPAASDFELRTRTLARAVLERDRQLGWQLLEHPRRLNIRTIDSVCAEIARTLPVLSGSGGSLAPTDNAAPFYREAARRTFLLFGNAPSGAGFDPLLDPAVRDLLLHRDGNLADCETLLADMLALRDQWGALIPLTHPKLDDAWLDANVLPRLQRALEQAICAGLTHLTRIFPPHLLEDLAEVAGHLGHAPPYDSENASPIASCAGVHSSPQAAAADRDRWVSLASLLITKQGVWRKERGLTGKNLGFIYDRKHRHHSRLAAVLNELGDREDLLAELNKVSLLPPAEYPANQWAVAKSLFRVLGRALVELQLVFVAHGQCDFTELSLMARAALGADSGPEDLAAALGARLQHLLVDEMQDTSAGQYDLIELLTASWDGHSQTVFLVGDPRQSIYLFRQARVARFLQTMRTQRLGELPLTCLRLTANFRSQKTLVDQFNDDFASVFPPTTSNPASETLPYTAAEATRPASPHASGLNWHANRVHIHPGDTLPEPQNQTLIGLTPAQLRQRQARRDAREIRRIARYWLAKPLPADRGPLANGQPEPWRVAVLVRSRSHLAEIVAAFDNDSHGRIPYRAVDITPLNERQEVLDLTALTRALLHPADRVAWLAVLRAPWCGLSLSDLHTLTGTDDPAFSSCSIRRLIADRGHLLGEESIQRLTRVWTVLEAAGAQRARLTASQLVERAWRSLGGDAWLKPEELINARRFFQLLDEMEAELGAPGRIDPALLNDRLQRLYSEPAHFAETEAHIDLMTIHGAKGLEWDAVLVPALERSPGFSRARLLTWSELDLPGSLTADDDAAPIMLAPIAAKGEEIDALTRWLKTLHKEREAAERKRLFYVASTRAREELHLFAAPDVLSNGNVNPRWDSLLRAAWPAAQPHFADISPPHGVDLESPPRILVANLTPPLNDDISHRGAVPFPPPREPLLFNLEAAAPASHPTLYRVPLTFDPAARFVAARTRKLPYAEPETASELASAHFTRPEGSFAARSLGNAVHIFLELLATRIAAGSPPAALFAELPAWTPRIAAILRADGLPPAVVDRLTRETRAALENTLRDPDGLWLLAPHPGAATELSLTAWNRVEPNRQPASIRVDRTFRAGPKPCVPAPRPDEDFLWIVDYKTSAHGHSGLDKFMQDQRATYAPQLESYARILVAGKPSANSSPAPIQPKSAHEVRLALYYPAIPRLIWWPLTPSVG